MPMLGDVRPVLHQMLQLVHDDASSNAHDVVCLDHLAWPCQNNVTQRMAAVALNSVDGAEGTSC